MLITATKEVVLWVAYLGALQIITILRGKKDTEQIYEKEHSSCVLLSANRGKDFFFSRNVLYTVTLVFVIELDVNSKETSRF